MSPSWVASRAAATASLLVVVAIFFAGSEFAQGANWVVSMCTSFFFARLAEILIVAAALSIGIFTLHAVVLLVALVRDCRRTVRLLRSLRPFRSNTWPKRLRRAAGSLAIASRVDLVESPELSAFCYGLLSPRILVTTGLVRTLGTRELRAVLLHERYHAESFDPLRITFLRGVRTSLFYLRPLRSITERYSYRRELEADDHAVGALGSSDYLVKALSRVLSTDVPAVTFTAAAAGFTPAIQRVGRLLLPLPQPDAPFVEAGEARSLAISLGGMCTGLLATAFAAVSLYTSHLCSLS